MSAPRGILRRVVSRRRGSRREKRERVEKVRSSFMNFPYQVRESSRAKHIRLQFSAGEGLVVTVPRGIGGSVLTRVLVSKRRWIEKRFAERPSVVYPILAPLEVFFGATGARWSVRYRQAIPRTRVAREQGERLATFLVQKGGEPPWSDLRAWLCKQAREVLVPWVYREAHARGIRINQVRVGCQRTRWGSCSSRGTISINAKILFFPPHVVRYVIWHELCHTRHLNHSSRFWKMLEEGMPDYRIAHALAKRGSQFLPAWVSKL